jgi:hypothetical protein
MPEVTAKIYQPAKSAMQSMNKDNYWVLEFLHTKSKTIDSVMGWYGSSEMKPNQVKLKFATLEQAEGYAKSKGIIYKLEKRHELKPSIKSYNANFA